MAELELPIDRLRAGAMDDEEAIQVAADVIRLSRVHGHDHDVFELLATRLEAVKLRKEE